MVHSRKCKSAKTVQVQLHYRSKWSEAQLPHQASTISIARYGSLTLSNPRRMNQTGCCHIGRKYQVAAR